MKNIWIFVFGFFMVGCEVEQASYKFYKSDTFTYPTAIWTNCNPLQVSESEIGTIDQVIENNFQENPGNLFFFISEDDHGIVKYWFTSSWYGYEPMQLIDSDQYFSQSFYWNDVSEISLISEINYITICTDM